MSGYDLKKSSLFNNVDEIDLSNLDSEESHPPLIKASSESALTLLKKRPKIDEIRHAKSYPAILYSESRPVETPNVEDWFEDTEDSDIIASDDDEIIDMINQEDAEFQFRKAGDRRTRGVVDENAAALFRNLASRFGEIRQEVVIKNILRKSYLVERKQRTYDHSKSKAPELPKTPPPVKIRRPVYQTIAQNRLLKKVLKINPAIGRAGNESAMSIRSATPRRELKKGPYYEEPFEPASPPVHLPPALSDEIDIQDSFLLEEDAPTFPPKEHIVENEEFLKLARYHQHPSLLYQPRVENPQPIRKIIRHNFNILTVTDELESRVKLEPTNGLYSDPALPASKREVIGLANTHVMAALNPYFVNHFSIADSQTDNSHSNLKARSNAKMFKSAHPIISNVSIADPVNIRPVKLPPLKLHTENTLISVIGGVHSRSNKVNACQTRLRSLFRGNDKNDKLPDIAWKPKEVRYGKNIKIYESR
ncbi:hypothetical protein HDV06_006097 [Boothiomyces sp. JEL0866]|nr:hypothetical protein HDV06_006047 [Boothiomyces sp. JEL0866]KAJ3324839.1 hypothetical protein HDV06_006097 [Boothiomyces sp. JEL0866]